MTPGPVPLDEIEAAAREATDGPWHQMAAAAWSGTNESPDLVADCPLYADAIHIATADPLTVSALCEALRIAVEGLDVAHEALATAGVVYTQVVTGSISDSEGWVAIEKALRGPPPEGSIIAYDLADALAAVRELVDLGEKP